MKKRPYILSVAGFDPSGGAGLVADCKTFEALKCQGLSVCTANTIQTDNEFVDCNWIDVEIIKKQLTTLFNRFEIDVVKIGIVQDWQILSEIIDLIILKNPETKIIVDPVLSASANFDFQTNFDKKLFDTILEKIYVLTPNYEEIKKLYPELNIKETIEQISKKTNLYLKGGHNENEKGKDYLYSKEEQFYPINPKYKTYAKHGSGCVLSSAMASYLALGFPLLKSAFRAKRFTEKYLGSNKELLGNFRF